MKTVLEKKYNYTLLPLDGTFEISSKCKDDKNFLDCSSLMLKDEDGNSIRTCGIDLVEINKKGYLPCKKYLIDGNECDGYVDLLGNFHNQKAELNTSLIAFYKGQIPFSKIDDVMFEKDTCNSLKTLAENLSARAIFEKYSGKKALQPKKLKKIEKQIDYSLRYIQLILDIKKKQLETNSSIQM